ncbi:FAD-dependent monooxygenase [Ornithinimicrobium faecis]|uniref:FAD-dependent monooxygenase n=1 Tax=Ornithinimicrobium faecis TaxID=2934158 RepID=UPI0021184DFB|nr:FAD-dependent monooxygenase [Ornithinimicrobium sp. HY1745]
MSTVDVPVLVIGGGGCGLSASIFLSDLGVEHMLVERHATTSHLPKAHYLNTRTLEVFRQHGVADQIYEVGAPIENFGKIKWVTSLGGERPLDRRLIHEMDAFGGGALRERYLTDSPSLASNYPQLRLEPLLREEAEKRANGQILFNHAVTDWEQLADGGVRVSVLNNETNETRTVNARYVIAADGGRTVGPKVGVEMAGPTDMVDMVSVHFSADLSEFVDSETLIHWFLNPEGESSWDAGAIVRMGPTWDNHSEEWTIHFMFRPDDPERFDETAIVPRVRDLLKLPDLDITVHKVSHWILDRVVATQWRFGDIFLAGDAAHRQPPTSGLGLNTGIQDAHAIAWRLAAAVNGVAGEAVLDSYATERIPVAIDGADWALLAFSNHAVIDAAIGLVPGASVEQNIVAFETLFGESRVGGAIRARTADAIGTQRFEFQAHDIEMGYTYTEGSFVPDGGEAPPKSLDGTVYTPSTTPGRRVPHAWLEVGGEQTSTLDLVGDDWGFTLITDAAGQAWADAAAAVSEASGVPIVTHVVGADGGPADASGRWAEINELDKGGALLIRPDQIIAWRSTGAGQDPAAELRSALLAVLDTQPVA